MLLPTGGADTCAAQARCRYFKVSGTQTVHISLTGRVIARRKRMRQAWQTAIVAGVLLIGASAGDPGTGYVYVANVTYGSRGQSFHPWPPLPSNVTSVHDFSYTVLLWVDPAAVSSTAPASSSVLQVGTGLGVTLQNTRSVCVYTTAANATADQIQTASWMFLGITVYGGPRRNITLNLIGSDGTVVERAARLPSDLSVPNSTVWLTGPSPSPPPFFGVVADLRLWAHALSVSDLMKVRASVMPLATTTPQPGVTGGTAYQGYALNLTCDRGLRIASIRFASFGTPSGLFPAFAMGPYHAANSSAIVRNRCAGLPSCSVPVATSLFGDPASGQQPMRLSVVAQCSITTTRAVVKRAVTVRHTSGTRPGLPSKPLTSAPVNRYVRGLFRSTSRMVDDQVIQHGGRGDGRCRRDHWQPGGASPDDTRRDSGHRDRRDRRVRRSRRDNAEKERRTEDCC